MPDLVFDSVTILPPQVRGHAVLAASHGGVYAALLAAKAGVKAVILCDAAIGRLQAGIMGLHTLDRLSVPAAAVSYRSARIGHGADCVARGVLSSVNPAARRAGVTPGMAVREALELLETLDLPASPQPPDVTGENRSQLTAAERAGVRVSTLDSNALVTFDDAGHIIVTGSHGGLLGGRPETAVKYDVFAAVYNDAGFGIDDAGISRLPALDARGIAGVAVSAWSACIGDGLSTYRDGIVSAVNATAAGFLVEVGITTAEAVAKLVQARSAELKRQS